MSQSFSCVKQKAACITQKSSGGWQGWVGSVSWGIDKHTPGGLFPFHLTSPARHSCFRELVGSYLIWLRLPYLHNQTVISRLCPENKGPNTRQRGPRGLICTGTPFSPPATVQWLNILKMQLWYKWTNAAALCLPPGAPSKAPISQVLQAYLRPAQLLPTGTDGGPFVCKLQTELGTSRWAPLSYSNAPCSRCKKSLLGKLIYMY